MTGTKAIVYLLLLIFSVQLLPVRQVGSLLYSNQITEELPHGQESSTHSEEDNTKATELEYWEALQLQLKVKAVAAYIIQDHQFHTRNADDIMTPPPNSAV